MAQNGYKGKNTTIPVQSCNTNQICFGFDRASDERSLKLFLERFINNRLLHTLLPRLDDTEVTSIVDLLTGLMKKHLTKKEYHELFLSISDT